MTQRSIVAVSAGLGQPSATRLLADRLVAATERSLRDTEPERGIDAIVQVIELRDHAQDLINDLLTGFPGPPLRTAIDAVVHSDGLIAVSPIFNASYSGLFKLFFDVLERDGLAGKPVLIGATGGTPRHSLALDHAIRPMFAYLNALVMPTPVFAASDDWGQDAAPEDGALIDRIERAGREFAGAIASVGRTPPADPFADPVPFDQLLRSSSS